MSTSSTRKYVMTVATALSTVLAFAAGGPASAATRHGPASAPPGVAVSATVSAPVQIPVAPLIAGTSAALPTITITDPGLIPSGNTVTLRLITDAADVSLDTAAIPVATATGASAGPVTVAGDEVSFTVTKAVTTDHAGYVVSGIHLVGTTDATSGAIAFGLDAGVGRSAPCSIRLRVDGCIVSPGGAPAPDYPPEITAPTFDVGAVTHLIPAAYGATAPDTAAALFAATDPIDTDPTVRAVVLVSDSEPQDAESADYLSGALSSIGNPPAPILLTDPTTLSPAVTSALDEYPSITDLYIVGGTSVVSAAIATQLAENYTVTRLAGPTQYDTNAVVDTWVANNIPAFNETLNLDYTQTQYNSTTGTSSATSTGVGSVKTAIVASGDIDSYQDGIVSGPFSVLYGLPVILTTPSTLSSTAQTLLTEGNYKQVVLLGGPLAVSNSVESQLTAPVAAGGAGVVVFRVAGVDASDTSTKLASFLDVETREDFHPVDQGSYDGGILITRGNGFQDALAAGPYAGERGFTPILLTENATSLGAPLTAYLTAAGQQCIYSAQAIGGPLSVTPAVQQAAVDAEFSGLSGCTPSVP